MGGRGARGADDQSMLSLRVPGTEILITPAYVQLHTLLLSSAAEPATVTDGDPGLHGFVVFGAHAPGVNAPIAAEVWEAVIGLARLAHRPKGLMLTEGLKSSTLANGLPSAFTRLAGSTTSVDGAEPNEHAITAPSTTSLPTDPMVWPAGSVRRSPLGSRSGTRRQPAWGAGDVDRACRVTNVSRLAFAGE